AGDGRRDALPDPHDPRYRFFMTSAPRPPAPSARGSADRAGRPVLLLLVWFLVLGAFAALAPVVQDATGLPHEWLSLVMLAPALASVVVLVLPRWFPRGGWHRAGANAILGSVLVALAAVLAFFLALFVTTQRPPTVPIDFAGFPVLVVLLLQAI